MHKTPEEAVAWARASPDKLDILDAIQGFVSQHSGLRHATQQFAYSAIRSFFMHNRVSLPQDASFRIRSDTAAVERHLTIENVKELLGLATQPMRSMILVKWMGLLDTQGLIYLSRATDDEAVKNRARILSALQTNETIVRVNMPGRKKMRNLHGFYTFIGADALESLRDYFERERGWPRPEEPMWIYSYALAKGRVITKQGFNASWLRLLRRAGLIPRRPGKLAARYGFGVHNTRDLAISLLNTVAGLNPLCPEFWAGHDIDPLGYNQFYNIKPDYVLEQYRLAEPHLNIVSMSATEQENAKEMESLREEVAKLRGQFETILKTKFGAENPD